MSYIKHYQRPLNTLVKVSISIALAFNASISLALTFNVGDIDGTFDTNLSIGAGWRISDRDERQLSQGNLGITPGDSVGSSTTNNDDGNWNFNKGDTYSKAFKGASELSFGTDDIGVVVGAKYFYDVELKDEGRSKDDTGFQRTLNDATLDSSGADIKLMNANIYGTWDFDDLGPVSFKIGRHVLSWGESLFIPGGINIINPFDITAARAPGAELKDILLPVNMASTSFDIGDNLSVEAFYQLDWEKTTIDGCGAFFSFHDYVADDCGPVILTNEFGDQFAPLLPSDAIAVRTPDETPSDHDQFGISLRWYLENLNGSELGIYYIQYHDRLPYISGNTAILNPLDTINPIISAPSYFVEYPDRIKMYGISLSGSNDSGYSFAAEYSFRENQPIQWASDEILTGGYYLPYSRLYNRRLAEVGGDITQLFGARSEGYDRYNVSQLQASTIKVYDYVLSASRMTFLAEAGAVYVHDLASLKEARYGRPDHFGSGDFDGLGDVLTDPLTGSTYSCDGLNAQFAANPNPSFCDSSGYTTSFSWGYTVAAILDYESVLPGVNIQPEVAFSHDVKGNSPDPLGLFVEGRKALSVTLKATYQNQYQASLGLVSYTGGGRNNLLNDRDHVTANISVSF